MSTFHTECQFSNIYASHDEFAGALLPLQFSARELRTVALR